MKSRPIDILLLSIAGIFLLLGVTNIIITASGESTIAIRQGSGLAAVDALARMEVVEEQGAAGVTGAPSRPSKKTF